MPCNKREWMILAKACFGTVAAMVVYIFMQARADYERHQKKIERLEINQAVIISTLVRIEAKVDKD